MRSYKRDSAIVNGYLSRSQPDADTSRSHAVNWAAGVGFWVISMMLLLRVPL